MPDIVISEFMDEAAVDSLRQQFDVLYDPALVDKPEALANSLPHARALIVRNRTQVTNDLLEGGPALKCIGRLGVGLDNIDLDACASRNIGVFPAIGANDLSVAEYVITTAMILLRGAYLANDQMLAGDWPRQACSGREISGKILGLIGFGGIAQHTAGLARALGIKVVGYDPFLPADHEAWGTTKPLELNSLLEISDIVSLHVPLSDDTRHLINKNRLALMKQDAILINAARGGVVDEDALIAALKAKAIGGAALDVYEDEPLTADGGRKFADIPNLLLTPHIGGVTVESNQRVSQMIAERVNSHLNAER